MIKSILTGVLDENRGRMIAFTCNGLSQAYYNFMHNYQGDDQDKQLMYQQMLQSIFKDHDGNISLK